VEDEKYRGLVRVKGDENGMSLYVEEKEEVEGVVPSWGLLGVDT